MSILTGNRRRTVARDLTIGLVLTISVVIIGFSLANYFLAINQAEAVLNDRAKSTADNLAQVLAAPLWNIDTATVEQIMDAYQQIDDLITLKIFDESDQITYQYPQDDTADESDVITERRDITFEGRTIGSVEIVFTKQFLSEQLNTLLANLGITLAVILTVVAATQLLLRRLLTQPITQLAQGLHIIAEGDYKYQLPPVAQADIDVIAQGVNDMAGQISERDNQLRELVDTLEQRVDERTQELKGRTDQLEAIADVASSVASLQDMDQLLPYITKTVADRFGFYHAGIFLLSEDREYAVLRAANSEGGQAMLARKHQLRIGKEGLVCSAIDQKIARIALDVGVDAAFFDNPDLPATRSEIALPLMIGGEIIGALDVQSKEPNAFSEDDIGALTTLANQVAVAIENARLYQQSQAALQELDATFQRYTRNEWQKFMERSEIIGYRAHESGLEPITANEETKSKSGNGSTRKIPITLRDITLGALSVDMGERSQEYTEDEMGLIQAVADRLALALESARLLEDSQKAEAKERVIGEITGKIGASINLRNVLQTAVEELGRSIPGSEIVIRLDVDDKIEQ